MGLENGIILKVNKEIKLPNYTYIDCDRKSECEYEYEICYWRKFYVLRDKIITKFNIDKNKNEFNIDKQDVLIILNFLKSYIEREYEENYWYIEEVSDEVFCQVVNLVWLLDWLEMNENRQDIKYELLFYDSY